MNKTFFALALAALPLTSLALTPDELSAEVISEARKSIKAEKIEFTKASNTYFTAYITYAENSKTTATTTKKDTELVARSILKKLVKDGRKPGIEDMVFIHVHAIKRATGETRSGFIPLGKSSYDFNKDRIIFELD